MTGNFPGGAARKAGQAFSFRGGVADLHDRRTPASSAGDVRRRPFVQAAGRRTFRRAAPLLGVRRGGPLFGKGPARAGAPFRGSSAPAPPPRRDVIAPGRRPRRSRGSGRRSAAGRRETPGVRRPPWAAGGRKGNSGAPFLLDGGAGFRGRWGGAASPGPVPRDRARRPVVRPASSPGPTSRGPNPDGPTRRPRTARQHKLGPNCARFVLPRRPRNWRETSGGCFTRDGRRFSGYGAGEGYAARARGRGRGATPFAGPVPENGRTDDEPPACRRPAPGGRGSGGAGAGHDAAEDRPNSGPWGVPGDLPAFSGRAAARLFGRDENAVRQRREVRGVRTRSFSPFAFPRGADGGSSPPSAASGSRNRRGQPRTAGFPGRNGNRLSFRASSPEAGPASKRGGRTGQARPPRRDGTSGGGRNRPGRGRRAGEPSTRSLLARASLPHGVCFRPGGPAPRALRALVGFGIREGGSLRKGVGAGPVPADRDETGRRSGRGRPAVGSGRRDASAGGRRKGGARRSSASPFIRFSSERNRQARGPDSGAGGRGAPPGAR